MSWIFRVGESLPIEGAVVVQVDDERTHMATVELIGFAVMAKRIPGG
jgi:hypothetical protein